MMTLVLIIYVQNWLLDLFIQLSSYSIIIQYYSIHNLISLIEDTEFITHYAVDYCELTAYQCMSRSDNERVRYDK